jgi:hypothetical protein
VDIAIWSTMEQGLAITAGSLASLQPLVKRVGQRLGFWDTRPSMPGSRDIMPRTIGSMDRSKARKKSRSARDTFGMTTLDWEDSGEARREGSADAASYPKNNEIMLTREVAVTTKRGSLWTVSEQRGSESQEELTNKLSKETFGDQLAVPRCFLADGEQTQKS